MDRETFHAKVLPLTKKEQHYLKHPEDRGIYFRKLLEDSEADIDGEGLIHLDYTSPEDDTWTGKIEHSQFFDGQYVSPVMAALGVRFNKQTRFSEVPIHVREYVEMKYVYQGQCTAILKGKEIPMTVGDVLLLDRGTAHTILSPGENDLIFHVMMQKSFFNQHFMNKISGAGALASFLSNAINDEAEHDNFVLFRTKNSPTLRMLMENMLCEYVDAGLCSEQMIPSYLFLFFVELVRVYQRQKEEEFRGQEKNYMSELIRYVQENCMTCTLQETAKKFNYNPDYLSRTLKKSINMTFKDLVTVSRLEKAAYLLLNTDDPISEIAEQTGYQNRSFFYKKFQEFYHCTPNEYREYKGKAEIGKKE